MRRQLPMDRLVLRPREAAGLLGVAECTLRRWVKAGELRMFILGGVRGFRRADLEAFVASRTICVQIETNGGSDGQS